MWVWTSIMPGITVYRPRSITSAPGGTGPPPTETIRSSSMTMTALATSFPFGSTSLPARMAFVAAGAEAPRNSKARAATPLRLAVLIERSRFFDLLGDASREALGSDHARERAEAEDPTVERAVEAHVER